MDRIAIIGLGYVGLPLAIEFGKKYRVIGFDINKERIEELKKGRDHTLEADLDGLRYATDIHRSTSDRGLSFSDKEDDIRECNIYIVTVPTPIDSFNTPDLKPLIKASQTVGRVISKGDIVIYESTTYPGCTEEDCIPEIADRVDNLYRSIIEAGTHKAPSIKVAEASKIIENSQRDLNISFVNELAFIFDKVGIDTNDVIEAAATKWNFLRYQPGLVGGHCISVDPYYLVKKAEKLGYIPQVILSGRHVNNAMASFIASKVMKLMINKGLPIKDSNILILGVSFKENCPDIRNTKVVDIYREFREFGANVDIYDNWVDSDELYNEYGVRTIPQIDKDKKYSAIVLAVAHDNFKTIDFKCYHKAGTVVFDVKSVVDRRFVDGRL